MILKDVLIFYETLDLYRIIKICSPVAADFLISNLSHLSHVHEVLVLDV